MLIRLIKNKARAAAALTGLALFSGIGWRYLRQNTPIYTTGTDVPDATSAGNPEAAMEHSHKLLAMLRDVNWNYLRTPVAMWFLPDRQFAEKETFRSNQTASYGFPRPDDPDWAEVAFTCDIYLRQNTSQYSGQGSRSRPSGFVIVGWKNGSVTQVRPQDIRLANTSRGRNVWVYPGMRIYDPVAPAPAFVRNTAPPDSAVINAAAKMLPPVKQPVQARAEASSPGSDDICKK